MFSREILEKLLWLVIAFYVSGFLYLIIFVQNRHIGPRFYKISWPPVVQPDRKLKFLRSEIHLKYCNVFNFDSSQHAKVSQELQCTKVNDFKLVKVCLYGPELPVGFQMGLNNSKSNYFIPEDERFTGRIVRRALHANQDMGLIDIGANAGVLTMVTAVLNVPVVAVEPYTLHASRIHMAVHVNGLQGESITLVKNPILERRGNVDVKRSGHHVTFHLADNNILKSVLTPSSIILDDLLEVVPFKDTILYINVPDSLPEIFSGGQKLFQNLNILTVVLKWPLMKLSSINERSLFNKYSNVVKFLEMHKFAPHSSKGEALSLDFRNWSVRFVHWWKMGICHPGRPCQSTSI